MDPLKTFYGRLEALRPGDGRETSGQNQNLQPLSTEL
jgi:hypothetical protein